jgi:hypothetical protein
MDGRPHGQGDTQPIGSQTESRQTVLSIHTCLHLAPPSAPLPCAARRFQQGLTCEYVPLPVGSKQMVDDMWPLYKK